MNEEKRGARTVGLKRDNQGTARDGIVPSEDLRELFDAGAVKNRDQRKLFLKNAMNFREEANREERMASGFKKVVGNTDAVYMQKLLPDFAKLSFKLRPRSLVAGAVTVPDKGGRFNPGMNAGRVIQFKGDLAAEGKVWARQVAGLRMRVWCGTIRRLSVQG
jgi:hypothetical protein